MGKKFKLERAPFPSMAFGHGWWEGDDALPSWAGFWTRGTSTMAENRAYEGRVTVTVQPQRTRAPVITGRVLLFFFIVLLGMKVGAMWSTQLARLMTKVSWWIVAVPLACYFLVQIMRRIGRRRGIEPTEEQVGAYEFVKSNDAPLAKAVLKAIFDDYARIRKGFRPEDWEGLGTNATQVNQAEEMKKLIGLLSVHVLNLEKDGRAYVAFEFESSWDHEQKFEVITHGLRIVEIGPAGKRFDEQLAASDGGTMVGRN
jgi:hypothetical protein